MRRLRAGLIASRPGRLGSPSAGTTTGCLRWLDWARRGRRKLPDRGREERSAPVQEARSRGAKSPLVERREAARPASWDVRQAGGFASISADSHVRRGWIRCASRRSAPAYCAARAECRVAQATWTCLRARRAMRSELDDKGIPAYPAPQRTGTMMLARLRRGGLAFAGMSGGRYLRELAVPCRSRAAQ
jgi:hypothetical protein